MLNFSDRLIDAIKEKKSFLIAGIDTTIDNIPDYFINKYYDQEKTEIENLKMILYEYNKRIIDAVEENVIGLKFQSAFFEQYSYYGIEILHKLETYAKSKKLIVIFDGKRNDIATSARGYSNAYIGETAIFNKKIRFFDFDALTINAYLGSDCVDPFLEDCERYKKGMFILVKTSNPSSSEFQDILTSEGKYLYQVVAQKVKQWGNKLKGKYGYSDIGAVVGATQPHTADILRDVLQDCFFLVPGIGVQGGSVSDLKKFMDKNRSGILVNSSRDIIYAYKKYFHNDFEKSSYLASKDLKEMINSII